MSIDRPWGKNKEKVKASAKLEVCKSINITDSSYYFHSTDIII